MKKNILICIMLVIISPLISIETYAQSTQATNSFNSSYYLGWGNTATDDLPFRIGTGTPLPNLVMRLKANGDLNLENSAKGYQINDSAVIWYNGNKSDIFVGVNAGNSTMSGGGISK